MKCALLTGVGKEGQVGEVVARRLAADGFALILVDRTPENVSARAATLTKDGFLAKAHACDLADESAVRSLFQTLAADGVDALDAVVHMAGGFALSGPVAEAGLGDFEKQLTINLRTAFLVSRSAIPLLRKRRGSMVFFASESALSGALVARVSAYAASKSAVVSLCRSISQEEREAGVRANALAPAAIRTAANLSTMNPSSKFVERDDVAATVSYLCSEQSHAVTGQVIRLSPR
jgi:NAD(P)-dependent dehydrogenase (short-subunit alcohol dehydrogenase family)